MDDRTLFDSPADRARVKSRLAPAIRQFCERIGVGGRFHMTDLAGFVAIRHEAAPGSAERIFREMRRAGEIDYRVVHRRESLYEITALAKIKGDTG
jgi:hypothetical protein